MYWLPERMIQELKFFENFSVPSVMKTVTNRPNVSDWNLETGYLDDSNEGSYPIRVYSAQQNSALTAILQVFDDDMDYLCKSLMPGFKIFLHTPGELIRSNGISFRVAPSEVNIISIKPTLITTSEGLRAYDPSRRQCYFNGEHRLRFFKLYSQYNCETECLANYTLLECGCVRFSMPSNMVYNFLNEQCDIFLFA